MRGMDDLLIGRIRIEIENSRLVMVDPNDSMIVSGQGSSPVK
jgi:hypothetical protein